LPVFPTVNVSALLCPTVTSPKESDVEDREMAGLAGSAPVPLTGYSSGKATFVALCVRTRLADFGPAAVGANFTVTA